MSARSGLQGEVIFLQEKRLLVRSISQVRRAVLGLPKIIVHFPDFTLIPRSSFQMSAHTMDVVDLRSWPVRGDQMAISSTSKLDNTMLDSNVADPRCMAHIQSIFSLLLSVTMLAWSLAQWLSGTRDDKSPESRGQTALVFFWRIRD